MSTNARNVRYKSKRKPPFITVRVYVVVVVIFRVRCKVTDLPLWWVAWEGHWIYGLYCPYFSPGARFSKVPKLFGCISGDLMASLYLQHEGASRHETLQLFQFLFPLEPMNPALQSKGVGVLEMAFRTRKVFGSFEEDREVSWFRTSALRRYKGNCRTRNGP